MPDPVLDPGMGPVSGLEERELLSGLVGGVGGHGLVAPAVTLFEQRELRTGVGAFAAHDDPHPGRPSGEVEQAGELGDVSAVADSTVGVGGRGPHLVGTRLMASRTFSVTGNPTEYSRLRPRTWPCSVSQSSRSWEAPAPSQRTSSFLRCAAGTWAIASDRTAMWSAAVFDPAFPVRSIPARISVVLSHHTANGWNPKVFLNVGEASSFSLCATTIVASTSSTTTSPRSVPATFETGSPASLVASWDQTWRRTLARAVWIFFITVGVSSSSARHTVGAEATGPSTGAWWRSTSMSADRLPAIGEHHRDVDQDPAPVMNRGERAPLERLGQLGGQSDPVGEHPGRHAARVRHDTGPIAGD